MLSGSVSYFNKAPVLQSDHLEITTFENLLDSHLSWSRDHVAPFCCGVSVHIAFLCKFFCVTIYVPCCLFFFIHPSIIQYVCLHVHSSRLPHLKAHTTRSFGSSSARLLQMKISGYVFEWQHSHHR